MLFATIADFNTFVESNTGIDFESLKPSILAAELRFIKPIFGYAFYDLVLHDNSDNQIILDIRIAAKRALSNLALYLYVPISEAMLTDAGVRRGNSEASPGAYKYQVKELQKTYLERGFQHLEEMINLLEDNTDTLTDWTSSDEFRTYRSLFIRSGKDFEQYYSTIRYPRRLYTLLRSSMYNVQELQIAPSISQPIYDGIKTYLIQPDTPLPDEYSQLFTYLKYAIAHFTIGRGIATLMATMDENGVHVLSQHPDSTSELSKRQAASDTVVTTMAREAIDMGTMWLDKAVTYLNDTATTEVFPTWYALKHAEAVTPTSINDNLNGMFSL